MLKISKMRHKVPSKIIITVSPSKYELNWLQNNSSDYNYKIETYEK